jgi:hypothetical protein
MAGNLDLRPVQRLLLGVSESSRGDDDDLEEADRPAGTDRAPDKERKRRSRDRSFKKTNRAQFHRTPRTGR